jgi:4-amino-4-deoxy-L-arabinose transferase-like glycosyltransferase
MSAGDLIHSLRGAPAAAGAPLRARRASAGASARAARAGHSGSGAPTGATERVADPSWARPALVALLALTVLAYVWDLSASGYANSFYAAAVQAGTKSWKAFFFGSLDSSNFITVDKPPASLWVMALSGRIFGFSSASMLIPQALEGVAAVGLLYAAVKRWFGAGAGLVAGAVFALTPVAALMFRFNNPDALLVLLLVAAAYCLVRAIERAGTRWVLAAGTMIGFAFLAKMMQAFLVLPAFALVYAIAAPTTLRRRIGQLLLGGLAVLVSAGWWVAIVALWPASDRPFIDGSPDNSIINLIFGYNGLGRIFGSSGPGGGGGGANFSGATGPLRLFNDLMGGQASWLLPAALLALVGGLWARRHAPRTDRIRAALLLWGGWLLVTAAVFSFGQGVIHTYYTVALAPAIGALVAIGAALCWAHRDQIAARLMAAVAVAASAGWAYALLERTPSWEPWLRPLILTAAALGVLGLVLAPVITRAGFGAAAARRFTLAAAVLGATAAMAGPLAYAADTITTAHTGSIPSAGPANAAGMGIGGRGGAPGRGGGTRPSGFPGGGGAGTGATSGVPGLFGSSAAGSSSTRVGKAPAGGSTAIRGGNAAPSGLGGGGSTKTSAALVKALQSDASNYRWVAATSGSQSAATLELASDEPVMGIGGFNNEGGRLTLAAFKAYVAKGEIHYYIASAGGAGGGPGGGAGGSSTSAITSWVQAHYTAETIGGQTVYNLA